MPTLARVTRAEDRRLKRRSSSDLGGSFGVWVCACPEWGERLREDVGSRHEYDGQACAIACMHAICSGLLRLACAGRESSSTT